MMKNPFNNVPLCPPLAQLMKEHVSLQGSMDDYEAFAEELLTEPQTDFPLEWKKLQNQVAMFAEQLEAHSLKEEEGLFPMMANYIGREAGPIAVMEYEHEQAKNQLNQYIEASENKSVATAQEAESIIAFALQARQLLNDHFFKEENILYPMAQRMLSDSEKEQLAGIVGTA